MDGCDTLDEYAREWFKRTYGTFRIPGFTLEPDEHHWSHRDRIGPNGTIVSWW